MNHRNRSDASAVRRIGDRPRLRGGAVTPMRFEPMILGAVIEGILHFLISLRTVEALILTEKY